MDDADEEKEPKKLDAEALKKRGSAIMARITAAEKREDDWRKEALAAEKAYTGDTNLEGDGKVYDFNILHSNVETIVPAIYNSTPVPDIRPRRVEATMAEPKPPEPPAPPQMGHNGGPAMDPAQAAPQQPDPQAMLQFQQQMVQFQQAVQIYHQKKQADQDAKSYGTMLERSIAVQIDDNRLDAEIESSAQDAFTAGRGIVRIRFNADFIEGDDPQTEAMEGETISFEAVSWRDYREGPAMRWENVPWVAFRITMSDDAFEKFADEKLLALLDKDDPESSDDDEDDCADVEVWEYWDKEKRQVSFVRVTDKAVVKVVDDPLGLPDFFPMPQPVQPITVTGKRVPVCPFSIYKKLTNQLEAITKRIDKLVSGMKVRGLVAGAAQSLSTMSELDDNQIAVEANLEQLVQTVGIDKAIAWWPIEPAAKVIAQLEARAEKLKAAIYEITGISDIVRGASNAGETATAQQIKTQWGSLRIQKMQRLIERQVRDMFVMMAHVISTKFTPKTLTQMTGIELTQGVQALMNSPVDATYRVNVESDSTIKADLSRQKQDMTEFLQGTAAFFAQVGPIVVQHPESAEPLAEIYAASARNFKLGKQAEDALDRFVQTVKQSAQQPPKSDPEQMRLQAEAEFKKQELAIKQQEVGQKAQSEQNRLAFEDKKLSIEGLKLLHGNANADRSHQLAMNAHNLAMSSANATQGQDGQIAIGESPEAKSSQALMQGLQMIAETLTRDGATMMQALEQIAAVVSAPRKSEIQIDAKGNKSAISVPMLN